MTWQICVFEGMHLLVQLCKFTSGLALVILCLLWSDEHSYVLLETFMTAQYFPDILNQ